MFWTFIFICNGLEVVLAYSCATVNGLQLKAVEMDAQIFESLPTLIRKMVGEIEHLIGSQIVVRPRVEGDPNMAGANELATLDCWMDNGTMRVTLICPSTLPLPVHLTIHEMLHAWRNVVLPVFRLDSLDSNDTNARNWAAIVDNDLEHMFVIPAEVELAPEAINYWEASYRRSILQLQFALTGQPGIPTYRQKILEDLMRHWLVTSAIPQLGCRSILRSILKEYDYLPRAERLVADVARAFPDKVKMTCSVLDHFHRRRDHYSFAQFDVRERAVKFWTIPQAEA